MHHWTRHLFAIAAPLLLTGCLWGPGKFASELTLKRDGSFVLDYRGEIVLQLPPDASGMPPWTSELAHCYDGQAGRVAEGVTVEPGTPAKERTCTKAEIADQKSGYEKRAAEKLKENEGMMKAFGLPGLDDQSNRAFAARLMKYAGWRSVTYRGKGVFDVDYHFAGRATQDFLFPALPDNDLIIPFVAIRRRADGSALVTAPAFTGGGGPMAARAGAAAASQLKEGPVSRAEGRFTIITDGEVLTNNSEDGPAPHPLGHQLHWDVGPASNKIPETLIRL
jgi:hypothetical protein